MQHTDGRVFVVQGDLNSLVCDEVLIPTDQWLSTGTHFLPLIPLARGSEMPTQWRAGHLRVSDVLPKVPGLPRRRMVNSGGTHLTTPEWLMDSVTQALDTACADLATAEVDRLRARPLLALPLLGTGDGGYLDRRGEVIDGLLQRCEAAAGKYSVDVAIVCHGRSDFSAVQARRRQVRPTTTELAATLGRRARAGKLALFLGAGISVSAGLPSWISLLEAIARDHEKTRALPEKWGETPDPLVAASDLLQQLGEGDFMAAVSSQLGQRTYALAHALLASLPGREVVTTNFDALFETARSVHRVPALEVLPYRRSSQNAAYLLKLHGDADVKDVVLDAEAFASYLSEREPLAGLLQGLLLTRHLLFVGCSMTDPNVNRNIDCVTDLITKYNHDEPVGTILTLHPDLEMETKRTPHFAVVAAGSSTDTVAQAARELDILLDDLLLEATYDEGAHLLDPDYAALMNDEERETAASIRQAAQRIPSTPEWEGLRRVLQAHGATRG